MALIEKQTTTPDEAGATALWVNNNNFQWVVLDMWIALRWLSIKLFQMSWPDCQTLFELNK